MICCKTCGYLCIRNTETKTLEPADTNYRDSPGNRRRPDCGHGRCDIGSEFGAAVSRMAYTLSERKTTAKPQPKLTSEFLTKDRSDTCSDCWVKFEPRFALADYNNMNLLDSQRQEYAKLRQEEWDRQEKHRAEDKEWQRQVEAAIDERFNKELTQSRLGNKTSRAALAASRDQNTIAWLSLTVAALSFGISVLTLLILSGYLE